MIASRGSRLSAAVVAGALALAAVVAAVGWRAAVLAGEAPAVRNQVLPYGEVNWSKGYVRVSAIGLPPFGAGNSRPPSEVARENAVAMAQKRLLAVVLEQEARGGKVRELVANRPELKEQLRALVTGAAVAGRSYSDGSVEITLTIQTEGPTGLRAFLAGL